MMMNHNDDPIQEEFLRLLRAALDSLERENELQRQLRRAKESLVSTALKLQVAIKIAQDDELTISSLQQQLEHAKTKEIIATKQAEEALETINVLKIEVNSLRRRFQEPEKLTTNAAAQNLANMKEHEAINAHADKEVENMLNTVFATEVPRDIHSNVLSKATPFEQWKMNEFLFTPNTPAASFAHDQHVVNMLIDAANKSFHDEANGKIITRPTKTTIAKMKRTTTAQNIIPNTMTANDFDVFGGDVDLLQLSPERPGTVASPMAVYTLAQNKKPKDKSFYLNDSPEPKWGQREKFQHENMGRLNLWNTAATVETGNENFSLGRKPSSVRLKSLRVDSPSLSNKRNGNNDGNNESPLNNKRPNGNSVRFHNKISV